MRRLALGALALVGAAACLDFGGAYDQCRSGGWCAPGGTDAGSDGGAQPADSGSADAGPACALGEKSCQGSTLRACRADQTGYATMACAYGCSSALADGGVVEPHCRKPVTSLSVGEESFTVAGVAGVTELGLDAGTYILNSDTGAITPGRAQNSNFTALEVNDGVGFRQVAGYGVFSFGRLVVREGVTVKAVGSRPLVLAASDFVTLDGVIDARPMSLAGALCPPSSAGPGGGKGGASGRGSPTASSGMRGEGPAGGNGGSTKSNGTVGGGGGGGASAGSGGGASTGTLAYLGGSGGEPYTPAQLATFVGGSGGGGGGCNGASATPLGSGGGGGGAVALLSLKGITVGSAPSPGGVNAGGCGGFAGTTGGGGGAGGTILLEAPVVQLAASTVLAANGGGGGDLSGHDGQPGQFGTAVAYGGDNTQFAYNGAGNGAANNQLDGGNANVLGTVGPPGVSAGNGYGGGGGAGRIRLNSVSGAAVSPGVVFSPTRNAGGTTEGMLTLE